MHRVCRGLKAHARQRPRNLISTRKKELDLSQRAARFHLRRQLAIAEDVDFLAEAAIGDVEVDCAAPAEARREIRKVEVVDLGAQPLRALHRQHVGEAGKGAAGAQRERTLCFGRLRESLSLAQVLDRIREVHVHWNGGGNRSPEHSRSLAGVRPRGMDNGEDALEGGREGRLISPIELQVFETALREASHALPSHFCE